MNEPGTIWHARFAGAVRVIIAPLVLFFSGFFTMDFLLSGVYTWPRTSRIIVLTLTVVVLAYEFVYKEQQACYPDRSFDNHLKTLLYSCMTPYAAGILVLMALARLAA